MPDENTPNYVIEIKEGEISRLYVAMCALCHETATVSLPAQEIFERDLLRSGWKKKHGIWYCHQCS